MRLFFDPEQCSGCLSCVTYCSLHNEGLVAPTSARLRVELDLFGGWNAAHFCRQCKKAPCAAQCPESAIRFEAAGGYWHIDYDLCTGCKQCIDVCPFGAIFWDPCGEKVIKCETCEGAPLCAEVCPVGALTWRNPARKPGAGEERNGDA